MAGAQSATSRLCPGLIELNAPHPLVVPQKSALTEASHRLCPAARSCPFGGAHMGWSRPERPSCPESR